MAWNETNYTVIKTIDDKYSFAGPTWNTQVAKRFILKTKTLNNIIESSYYLHFDQHSKAVNVAFEPSTSYGCPIGCLFCASGTLTTIKHLDVQDITQQINSLVAIYRQDFPNLINVREDVFYSGIGEPTLIPKTLIDASLYIIEKHPRLQFKMSTMGANPEALITWTQSNVPLRSVQVGIPHWNESKVKHLYHRCKKYSLQSVLSAVKEFMHISPNSNIKINYIGIKGYNDTEDDLQKTIDLVTSILGYDIEFKISCLNATNYGKQNGLNALSQPQLMQFFQIAQQCNLKKVYVFGPVNNEKLGCGQLAWHYST